MELIAADELLPGSRLPPKRHAHKTDRRQSDVLREAFRVVEEQGIIVVRPGAGRYVRSVDSVRRRSSADSVSRLELATIFDILDAK